MAKRLYKRKIALLAEKKYCINSNDSETPLVCEVTEQDRREFYVSPLAFKTSHYPLRVPSFAKMDF